MNRCQCVAIGVDVDTFFDFESSGLHERKCDPGSSAQAGNKFLSIKISRKKLYLESNLRFQRVI